MNPKHPFKWRHFLPEIILWGVRWYCSYPISYRQLEEMMCERGVEEDHSTLSRWVQKYAPELDKRCPLGSQSPTEGNPPKNAVSPSIFEANFCNTT